MKALRSVLILLAAVAMGVLAAQWLSRQTQYDLGEVIVNAGGSDYVAPMPQAIIVVLLLWLALWLIWTLLALPFRAWGRYRRKKGRARLIEGLRAAENGQWNKAGRLLSGASEDAEVGVIALAAAVRVADARGDAADATTLAEQLLQRDPVTHALVQGQRLLEQTSPQQALDALDAPAAQPLPPRGLLLRTQALAQGGRAEEAYGQLGALRQQAVLPLTALTALEIELATLALQQATDANALAARWEVLSKTLRLEPPVVSAYVRRAATLHWDDAAIHSLEQALDTRWDESLVRLYGTLPLEKYDSRRASAQRWLSAHPDSPGLLLTLARLSRQQRQDAQAEEFLQRAIALNAGVEAWEELGQLFVARGDNRQGSHCMANALRLQRGEEIQPLPQQRTAEAVAEPVASGLASHEERDENGIPRLPGSGN